MNVQILVAEDNPADVRLIREALRFHQVQADLHVVGDGEKALGFVSALNQPAAVLPDLVFLDLNLPRASGREILRAIKETPGMQSVPVVILSSSSSPEDQAEAEQMGASRYFRKPCTLDEFMGLGALVKELVLQK